jgi:hypothetical protein
MFEADGPSARFIRGAVLCRNIFPLAGTSSAAVSVVRRHLTSKILIGIPASIPGLRCVLIAAPFSRMGGGNGHRRRLRRIQLDAKRVIVYRTIILLVNFG